MALLVDKLIEVLSIIWFYGKKLLIVDNEQSCVSPHQYNDQSLLV
jgi:hypothetical protein